MNDLHLALLWAASLARRAGYRETADELDTAREVLADGDEPTARAIAQGLAADLGPPDGAHEVDDLRRALRGIPAPEARP